MGAEPGDRSVVEFRWVRMDRAGMIETFREWADNQMKRHDDPATPEGLRDASFWQAMALYEVAETIEAGQFDPVRSNASEREQADG